MSIPNPSNLHMEQAKSITTLRSGKQIDKSIPVKADKPNDPVNSEDEDGSNLAPQEMERVYKPVTPFPSRLVTPKSLPNSHDILEIFRQVKINIPLLDAIKQIPSYAKFLKDLCTTKCKYNVQQKAFLNEQVSAILTQRPPQNSKIPVVPQSHVSLETTGLSVHC